MEIFGVMQAARIGILKTLIELDISGNKLDKAAAQVCRGRLCDSVLQHCFSLCCVVLRRAVLLAW